MPDGLILRRNPDNALAGRPLNALTRACGPGGEDSECAPGEVCITGNNMMTDWSLCTMPCMDPNGDECMVDDQDGCSDLPGDGEFVLYCAPVLGCDMQDPCPMGMQCFAPFGMGQTVCMWPG